MKLNTYLNYGGNCAEAFRFYEQHLGGKITMIMTHGQMPGPTDVKPEWADKVLHARIELGGTAFFGADIPSPPFEPMRSAYLSLAVDSVADAERIYGLLSEGGQIFMPMAETFFAHRFAMLRDKFGTSWMLPTRSRCRRVRKRFGRCPRSIRLTGRHALVSRPAASASFACLSSNVQKRCAFNSSAQATWSESSVRTPRLGTNRRAS